MPQAATNNVVIMPEPSNNHLPSLDPVTHVPGHRSPHKAGDAGNPAQSEGLPADAPSTEVFAVFGAEPEIQAYAMAKYSRSALSMKESLREISQQKAEKFLNT